MSQVLAWHWQSNWRHGECLSKTTTKFNFCLFAFKHFTTGESVRNQSDRIDRTLWTGGTDLLLMLTLNWPCTFCCFSYGIEECPIYFNIIPMYFNIILGVTFDFCSWSVLTVHWMDMSWWARPGVFMRCSLFYIIFMWNKPERFRTHQNLLSLIFQF